MVQYIWPHQTYSISSLCVHSQCFIANSTSYLNAPAFEVVLSIAVISRIESMGGWAGGMGVGVGGRWGWVGGGSG